MRIPCNLALFIDDSYVSATLIPKSTPKHAGIFVSERKTERSVDEREDVTISILKTLSGDIRDRLTKPELIGHYIDECNIILSPSWYISKSAVILKHMDKPIVYTKDLLMQEIKSQLENDSANTDDTSTLMKDLVKIEQDISHVMLNGYSADSDLYGKKVTSFKALVYSCFIHQKFKDEVFKAIDVLHHGSIKTEFHSLGKFCLNHTLSKDVNKNTLVVNLCSYMTELAYMKGGVEIHLMSIPMGYKDIITKLNNTIHSDHSSADSLIGLMVKDKLKEDSRQLLMSALDPIRKEWLSMVTRGLEQLPQNPNSEIDLHVYSIDEVQSDVARLFAGSLPFSINKDLSVTLFQNMLANFSVNV